MNTKSFLLLTSYLLYFVSAVVLTYMMQFVTILFIGGVRFTAADSYPGDVSGLFLIASSIILPIIHFGVLFICIGIHSFFTSIFNIEFRKRIPLLFNIIVMLCLIGYFLYEYLVVDPSILAV